MLEDLKNKIAEYSNQDLRAVDDIMRYQNSVNGLHPHNEVLWKFIHSRYYDHEVMINYNQFINENKKNDYDHDLIVKMRGTNLQALIKLESTIKNKGVRTISEKDILTYVDILGKQIAIETGTNYTGTPIMYLRHGYYPPQSAKEYLNIDEISSIFEVTQDLIECNLKMDWDDITLPWRKLMLISWKLYEIGAGDFVIKFLTPLYDAINIFIEKKLYWDIKLEKDFIFDRGGDRETAGPVDFPPFHRIKNSISWLLAMSYFQINDIQKYLEILKGLDNSGINSYRINNRHLEAAIRIYSSEKNKENLDRVYSVFNNAISNIPTESMESVMERCIAMYDFYEKIY